VTLPPHDPAAVHSPDALAAFVHGIEARSWVLADAQAGGPDAADALLDAAVGRFAGRSAGLPLAQWPLAWWNALLEQPDMLAAAQPAAADPLRRLAPGPRAALLLRLVAGLDVAHAAKALGVSTAAYEAALARALAWPGMDDAAMDALRTRLHAAVHAMPGDARQGIARRVTEALGAAAAGAASPPRPAPVSVLVPEQATARAAPPPRHDGPSDSRRRAPRWALPAGLALIALVAAAVWWSPARKLMRPGAQQALPPEPVAAAPALDAARIVTHPDYQQLADPEQERLARDLAFLSWLAASTEPETVVGSSPPAPVPDAVPDAQRDLLAPAVATWPSLDEASRRRLLAQAADWTARNAARRAELANAIATWDQLPPTERARRRAPLLAWTELAPADRARATAAARRFAQRTLAEQTDLRLQFAALPDDTQQLWRLGPSLGPELTAIAPLFAFLPEAERPPLLAALRSLDLQSRRDLALLAPRLSEAGRDRLRRELVAAAPGARAGLVRAQLAQ
jgi:hypothetical protein